MISINWLKLFINWLSLIYLIFGSHYGLSLSKVPKLLLISFDGFRSDYVDKNLTPSLYKLSKEGVTGGHMKSLFITKTFPNHFSIVTGFYEDIHGIVHNFMYDPIFNQTFSPHNTEQRWWDNNSSIPIWVANEMYNDGLVRNSGVMMWPGSSTKIHGHMSRYIQEFDRNMNWYKKIDIIMQWFLDSLQPANCIIGYFDEPDSTAHLYGPFSQEVKVQLKRIDQIVSYLLTSLSKAKLLDQVNIIFVSDHGMAEVPQNQMIELDKYVPSYLYKMYGSSPNWGVFPIPGRFSQVFQALKNASKKESFQVYKKKEVPVQYHYQHNRRIAPIIVVANEGWEIYQNKRQSKTFRNKTLGEHGYNNSLPSMRPLFLANGPAFKRGYYFSNEFENIDIYPLMCYILNLLPLNYFPSNGSFEKVSDILAPVSFLSYSSSSDKWFSILIIFAIGSCFICCSGVFLSYCATLKKPKCSKKYDIDCDVVDIDLNYYLKTRKKSHKWRVGKSDESEKKLLLT